MILETYSEVLSKDELLGHGLSNNSLNFFLLYFYKKIYCFVL